MTKRTQHRGEIVNEILRKKEIDITELAKRMKRARRTFYNWFEAPELSWEIIEEIGAAIKHDFHENFPDMPIRRERISDLTVNEPMESYHDNVKFWRDKYIGLLEKYNHVLAMKIDASVSIASQVAGLRTDLKDIFPSSR